MREFYGWNCLDKSGGRPRICVIRRRDGSVFKLLYAVLSTRHEPKWNSALRDDPIVAEVRRIREALSAEFDFDPKAIFEDLRKRQAALGEKLVRQRVPPKAEPADAADRRGPGEHAS